MATINEALKSLILAMGGDPESMYDNTTISDYIKDLETAMQASGSGAKIDDTTASDSTVYSSAKTESLIPVIPDPELPSVAVGDIGEALIVESDGEGGAQWGKGNVSVPQNCVTIPITMGGGLATLPTNYNIGKVCQLIDNGVFVVLYNVSSHTYYSYNGFDSNSVKFNYMFLKSENPYTLNGGEIYCTYSTSSTDRTMYIKTFTIKSAT